MRSALVRRAAAAALALTLLPTAAGADPGSLDRLPGDGAAREGASPYVSDPGTAIAPANSVVLRDLAVTANGTRAYALDDERLTVLDVTRRPSPVVARLGTVFGTAIAVRRSSHAYVVRDRKLQVVDVKRQRPRQVRVMSSRTPNDTRDVAVSPDGRFLYISYGSGWPSGLGNGVRVMSLANPAKPRPVARWKTGPNPVGIAVSKDGARVVTANSLGDDATVVNTSNPRRPRVVRARVDLPFEVEAVTMVGRTAYLYGDASRGLASRVGVVSTKKGRLGRVKTVVNGLEGGSDIEAAPDGRYLVVTHREQPPNAVVSVVRRSTLTRVASFGGSSYPGPSFPEGLAVSRGGSTKGDFFLICGTGLSEPEAFFPFSRR